MTMTKEYHIPNSSIVIKHVSDTISINVREHKYERGVILTKEEFEYLFEKIAPQILKKEDL